MDVLGTGNLVTAERAQLPGVGRRVTGQCRPQRLGCQRDKLVRFCVRWQWPGISVFSVFDVSALGRGRLPVGQSRSSVRGHICDRCPVRESRSFLVPMGALPNDRPVTCVNN